MATGDFIFKAEFPACDPITAKRHVKFSVGATVLAEGELAGAAAAEFTNAALEAPHDAVVHIDVVSSAPGFADVSASFDVTLTNTLKLTPSGAPTLVVTGVAP